MVQEVTILLILAELNSKVELKRTFWKVVMVGIALNIGMIIFIYVLGHSKFLGERSILWFCVAFVEFII